MSMQKTVIIFFVFLLLSWTSEAQKTRKADRWYSQGAYYQALQEYCRLLSGGSHLPEQGYIEFQAGKCCMKMNRFLRAVEWFEKAEKDYYTGEELWRQLGEVYLIRGKYAEARKYFELCRAVNPEDRKLKVKIASCDFGLQAAQENPSIEIIPLPYLNTRGSEYGIAFFPGGLLYSSTGDLLPEKKREISQRTGMGYSQPYVSFYREGSYQPGRLLAGMMKSGANDGAFGYDWNTGLLYCSRCEEGEVNCRIIFATLKNRTYRQTGELKTGKRKGNIAHPFITQDGTRIYFSSTMEGGFGGADIWYMDRLPNGKWSEPYNVGPSVNTEGNEIFPYIQDDHFYFASDGRVGFGGLDIYCSRIYQNGFEEAQNLGAGINTSYDDFNLILNEDGRSGLLISNRLPDRSDDIYYFKETGNVPENTMVYVSKMLDGEEKEKTEEIELKDSSGLTDKTYRLEVAEGDVSNKGYWVQVAMLMKSDVIGYDLATRVTALSGKRVVMYKGKDGGHRFYIGVYVDEHEARKAMVILRTAGIDCFVKQVRSEEK